MLLILVVFSMFWQYTLCASTPVVWTFSPYFLTGKLCITKVLSPTQLPTQGTLAKLSHTPTRKL